MVTIPHQNRMPEMLASIRRKPFAKPTAEELIEHLLTRVPRSESRKDYEKHAYEHILSPCLPDRG